MKSKTILDLGYNNYKNIDKYFKHNIDGEML